MSRERVILNWRVMIGEVGVAEVHDARGVLGVQGVQSYIRIGDSSYKVHNN